MAATLVAACSSGNQMHIKIIQWNISYSSKKTSICEYLLTHCNSNTLICLQEVTENTYAIIVNALKPASSSFSLDFRKAGKNEGANRRLGVAILSMGGQIISSLLMDRTVFPERSLYCSIAMDNRIVNVLTFHSLTGVDYKKAKSSNFASIADFLELHDTEIDFLCFDANEPKYDSMIESEIICNDNRDKGTSASMILGNSKVHSMKDAYVSYLLNTNQQVSDNPLTVSYKTRMSRKRYDYIYHHQKWTPNTVIYPYEESVAATSDHSAVIGDFSL